MACSPQDGNASTKRVCVGDCFDVDNRGRLQMKFAPSMNDLFTCTDEGFCYSHEYPVCVDTYATQTGCGRDVAQDGLTTDPTNDCVGDGFNFLGSGPKYDAAARVYPSSNADVNDETCSPTLSDNVNDVASTNELELVNDSCTPWKVSIQTDQFYGFIDDFQPFKAGYARVLGEVNWSVDDVTEPSWQRVYELARSGQDGVSVDASCNDCCDDLPEEGGTEENPTTPRQDCIDVVTANQEQAQAVIRLLNFSDRLNTTGGAFRTFVTLQPGETLKVETRARVSATCDQAPIIGARAGHISMMAWPLVGCDASTETCGDCDCGKC